MATPVVLQRFINTPTVMELYEEENKGADLGVDDKVVDDLSDEYNEVTGNEGYYKLLFAHMQTPHANCSVAGNEGLLGWVKDGIKALITGVKNFFKWLWSFFTSKKVAVEQKAENLEEALSKHGVKKDEIQYPVAAAVLWASPQKMPASLDWMKAALDKLDTAMGKGETYVKEVQSFVEAAGKLQVKAFISEHKTQYDKLLTAHIAAVSKLFTTGDFVGGTKSSVGDGGKVKIDQNAKVLKTADGKFKTTDTQVRDLLKEVLSLNKRFDSLLKTSVTLEAVFVKQLNTSMEWAWTVELKDQKAADSIITGVKQAVTNAMATIKVLENTFFRAISSGLTILDATVAKGK